MNVCLIIGKWFFFGEEQRRKSIYYSERWWLIFPSKSSRVLINDRVGTSLPISYIQSIFRELTLISTKRAFVWKVRLSGISVNHDFIYFIIFLRFQHIKIEKNLLHKDHEHLGIWIIILAHLVHEMWWDRPHFLGKFDAIFEVQLRFKKCMAFFSTVGGDH